MPSLTVMVTAEDIEAGERENCERCPVALALGRATDEFWTAHHNGLVRHRDRFTVALMPPHVRAFMEAFDARKPVTPFAFTIDVP